MKTTLDQIHNKFINTAILVVIIALIPSLISSLFRYFEIGWQPIFSIHLMVGVIVLVLYVFRNKLSAQFKIFIFSICAYILGLSDVYYFGLFGGYVFIILGVVISIVGQQKKHSIYLLISTLLIFMLLGYLHISGNIGVDFDLNEYNKNLGSWLTKWSALVLTSLIVVYAILLYNSYFIKAMAELTKSAESMEKSMAEIRLNLKYLPVAIILVDYNNEVLFVNNQFSKLLGFTLNDLKNEPIGVKSLRLFDANIDGNIDLKSGPINTDRFRKDTKPTAMYIETRSGTVLSVEVSVKELENKFLISVVDMTERMDATQKLKQKEQVLRQQNIALRQGEEELRQQNEEFYAINEELTESNSQIQHINLELQESKEKAEESDRLKSAFLANMSHEIRTPMNGIIGFSELISLEEMEEDERRKYAGIIYSSSKQLLNILNDIIDLSKIESGTLEVFNSSRPIKETINEAADFFSEEASNKGLSFIVDIEEDFDLVTDHTKLNQVLVNLLSNAIKFTQEGEIRFGARKKDSAIEFYVKDTGVGIPIEKQGHIFERFFRAHEGQHEYGGTGLGLSISYAIVKALGGELRFNSEPGVGSTFSFVIADKKTDRAKIY